MRNAYGKEKLTVVDHFGVFLSIQTIKKYLPNTNQLNLVDLGCGFNAKILRSLQHRIKTGTGVDFNINPNLKNKDNLFFLESSIEAAFPHLEAKPDVILLISTLEHLKEPDLVLRESYSLLNPGGVMLINVPTWRGKFFLEFSAFKLGTSPKFEMDDHKMYYDKRDLWPMLVKSGFKPSKIKLKYHKFGLNLFAFAQKD